MSQFARLRADDTKYVVGMSFSRRSCVAELVEAVFSFLRWQVLGELDCE